MLLWEWRRHDSDIFVHKNHEDNIDGSFMYGMMMAKLYGLKIHPQIEIIIIIIWLGQILEYKMLLLDTYLTNYIIIILFSYLMQATFE